MQVIQIPHSTFQFQIGDAEIMKVAGTEPHFLFFRALKVVQQASADKFQVVSDGDSSEAGKVRKLSPIYEAVWGALCASICELMKFGFQVDQREAALLKLPTLDPTATAVAIEDREVRDWWRALSLQERTRIMGQMQDDEAARLKWFRLQIALLRSPVPMPDREIEFMNQLWAQTQRSRFVEEAHAIDAAREAIEWCTRGLAHLQAACYFVTDWRRENVLAFIIADEKRLPAAPSLGFSSGEIAAARWPAPPRKTLHLA